MSELQKSLIVITGASSGIGAATAIQFSKLGHPLLLLARRVERLQALSLPNSMCVQVDVTNFDALKSAIEKAENQYGSAEAIVNNAGVMLLGDVGTQNPAEWKQMLDVNVLGVLNGMQAVLPQMKARRSGTIINVSSVAGRKTFGNHAAYCATKFGVHALTENAREEAASSNVRMVTIAPGAVETELLSHTTSEGIKEGYESWKESIGGAMRPEDVAEAIVFAFQQPQRVNIREIVLAATQQQP